MIEARIPGKLYIAGEYAVVEPGEAAVLIAVNRFLTVRLGEAADAGHVRSSLYGSAPRTWVRDRDSGRIVFEHDPIDYVVLAIDVVEQLRAARGIVPRYCDLDIVSELGDESGRKFGLGSSGAVTVAVVTALDQFYELGLSTIERYKLALLATIEIAPRSSGGDLAASTFGGWIRYTSPDRAALHAFRVANGVAATLDSETIWEGLSVTPLPEPASLQLLVGWTGRPASTTGLVAKVGSSARTTPGGASGDPHTSFIDRSRHCVSELVDSLNQQDAAATQRALREARGLLQGLGETTGIMIETEQLRSLCDIAESHGAAAKPSGAGGGDCGIALAATGSEIGGILREWEEHDILRLPLSVCSAPAETGGSHD